MTTAWLTVVGIGEDGLAALAPEARAAIAKAGRFVGGARHLAMLDNDPRPRLAWPVPLDPLIEQLSAMADQRIVVLASGDPLWFGIGRKLVARFGPNAVTVVPHVASMQLACARLRWSLSEVDVVTIHGRPHERLARWLQPGRRLVILCADGQSPAKIAELLLASGFSDGCLHVLEHLGGPDERAFEVHVDQMARQVFRDLVIVALEVPRGEARSLPLVPGLPDNAFVHDGQITKREVRAATLAKLAPMPGERLWDVGSGSGAIAIEWLRSHLGTRAIAVERHPERAARIRTNAKILGTPELEVVEGEAPSILTDLPAPDAIFLGGSVGATGMIDSAIGHLRRGGRLVANAVTLAGEAALLAAADEHGGDLTRIAVAHAEPVGASVAWRALAPVTQWSWTRP